MAKTIEEALQQADLSDTNYDFVWDVQAWEEFYIDAESRTITVPESERLFGVESDERTERKHFRCPQFVGDDIDLSELSLRVHYRNANNEADVYIVDDVAVVEENAGNTYIIFSWLLSRKVTKYKGPIQFIVCAVRTDGDTVINEWNTTLAGGVVLEGLESDVTIAPEEKDVLNQLISMADQSAKQASVASEVATDAQKKATQAVEQAEGLKVQLQTLIDQAQSVIEQLDGVITVNTGIDFTVPEGEAENIASGNTIPQVFGTVQKVFGELGEAATYDVITDFADVAEPNISVPDASTIKSVVEPLIDVSGEGERIELRTESGKQFGGMQIFGRSVQDGSPSPDNPVPIVSAGESTGSIIVSVSGDGGELQELVLSTPNGLPGIPVSEGGNYTDGAGQQWVCDEIDLERGVYVKRVEFEAVSKFTILKESEDSEGRFISDAVFLLGKYKNGEFKNICNFGEWTRWGLLKPDMKEKWVFAVSDGHFYVRPPLGSGYSVDSLNEYLHTIVSEQNPIIFVIQLLEVEEIPLEELDLIAYAAMHTNSPMTVITNGANTWMNVKTKNIVTDIQRLKIDKVDKTAIEGKAAYYPVTTSRDISEAGALMDGKTAVDWFTELNGKLTIDNSCKIAAGISESNIYLQARKYANDSMDKVLHISYNYDTDKYLLNRMKDGVWENERAIITTSDLGGFTFKRFTISAWNGDYNNIQIPVESIGIGVGSRNASNYPTQCGSNSLVLFLCIDQSLFQLVIGDKVAFRRKYRTEPSWDAVEWIYFS